MKTVTFKEYQLCNSNRAVAFYYPKISGGRDLVNDVTSMNKTDKNGKAYVDIKMNVLLLAYVAFRMAADKSLVNKDPGDIMDEVNLYDPEESEKFVGVIFDLMYEPKKA